MGNVNDGAIHIGECFASSGPDAAHINVVIGSRAALGTAWSTALATPRMGHTPFVAVLQPNQPVKPLTLFVNKAPIADPAHGDLTWGAAQAGVALGVTNAVANGVLSTEEADEALLIAAVWVDPAAGDASAVFANNTEATETALRNALAGKPKAVDVVKARDEVHNPFFDPRPSSR